MLKFLLRKHHFIVTGFVLGAFWLLGRIPLPQELDAISSALGDFEVTDIVFAEKRDTTDTNLVLVNVTTLNRRKLAQALRVINAQKPKAVGIDLFFRKLKGDNPDSAIAGREMDTALTNALSEIDNLVLVSAVTRPNEQGGFDSLETCSFEQGGFDSLETCSLPCQNRKIHQLPTQLPGRYRSLLCV
jgi:hypothetical protein